MERNLLSVVIIARNEESNIEDCLLSCQGWANEIIIVDDDSSDKTIEISKKYTDKIFQRKMDNEGTHRNWAYQQASYDWVLSLDADERITPELQKEIDQILVDPQCNVYTIPRRNFIGDYWLKHGGQYPSAQLRLFSKSKSAFCYEEVEVHPTVSFNGPEARLQADIIHYSYKDIAHFLQKMNGQTTLEAKKHFRLNRKIKFGKFLWRTIDRFIRVYFRKKANKDGLYGLVIAYFSSAYQMISYAKFWEFTNRNQAQKIKDVCGCDSFAQYITTINEQTTAEVVQGKSVKKGLIFWKAAGCFLKVYFGPKGLKNGFVGFMLAYLASFYQVVTYFKYCEKTDGGARHK